MEEEWIYVRESNMWNLPQEDKLILPALRLSYHHLPLQLRQCFAYFAAFPKDHFISRTNLIFLWMAHGYISSTGKLEVEDIGNEICDELLLRSLFEETAYSYVYGEKYYYISMHDLVHDLAQSIMENKVPGIQIESNIMAASTIREVSLQDRTIFFPKSFQQDMDISSILENTSLRVLDASSTVIENLPHSIVKLKHLRYLNLSSSGIRTLPNSLCSLWNLQILNLDFCKNLVALPKKMRYLNNLQRLCLRMCDSLSEMPSRIGELSLLKTLSMFVVGLNKGNLLEELQCLNLRGRLEIRHLERVKDHMDANRALLSEKKNLRELILCWERDSLSELGEDIDEKVLEALQPHPNLKSLSIRGYNGRYFGVWMTNSILEKIVEIDIKNCRNFKRLPELGELPLLQSLRLENLVVEYIIEDEVQNGNPKKIKFPSLKRLQLQGLPNLKGLSKEQGSKEAFPNLIKLHIKQCSLLILSPLSSLQNLETLECSSSTLALFSELDNLTALYVEIEERLTCFPVETVAKFSNLESLSISGAKEISVRGEGEALQVLKKLHHFCIEDCETMRYLPKGMVQQFTALRSLSIGRCPELVEVPEEIKHLQNLNHIWLYDLAKMACLPEALQHLSSLRSLHLNSLPLLDSLPKWLHKLTSLLTMSVGDCAKVASLPDMPNLNYLRVQGCPEVEWRCRRGSGEDWHKIAHIPRLTIGR